MTMLFPFLTLILCQLLGELIREAFYLPIPGPVIGMFLLTAILGQRSCKSAGSTISKQLEDLSEGLIRHLGLLFVPAGVGIIAEIGVLQREWLPIVVGVLGSTILSVATTGLVMHWVMRKSTTPSEGAPEIIPTKLPAE